MDYDKCSECRRSIYKTKYPDGYTYGGPDRRLRATCGPPCERARKTRLQRERRAQKRRSK